MQDPFGFDHSFHKPKVKPPRKQVGLLQPKGSSLPDNTLQPGKAVGQKAQKIVKRSVKERKQPSSFDEIKTSMPTTATMAARPVVDMMRVIEGDSRSIYRTLKRKYTNLEEESFKLVEELETTEKEVKQLEEEKMALLDELLVLEGLAFNPYPPVDRNRANLSSG